MGVLADSVLISMLVAGAGGIGSAFTPVYLLAALGISRAPGNRKVAAGVLLLVAGYLAAAWVAVLDPVLLGQVVLIAVFCGAVGFMVAARPRGARKRAEILTSALEAERSYHQKLTATISNLDPLLSVMDCEGLLGWAAGTAREATEAAYAHVAMIDGRHRTVVEGDHDVYPSWWHPTIQRLVLHGTRTAMVQRTDETVHDVESFLTVPLIADDGTGLGVIVVGGGNFGSAEERVLALLAAKVVPALRGASDAPDGRDALTGLPNRGSLYRVLQRRLVYEGSLTVMALCLNYSWAREGSIDKDEKTLLRTLGQELSRAHRWVFYLGEGRYALLLGGGNQSRTRKVAFAIQHTAEKVASGQAVPSTASVGFTIATGVDSREPSLPVEAALDALRAASEKPHRIASYIGDEDLSGLEKDRLSVRAEIALALVAAAEVHSPPLGDHLRAVSRTAHHIGIDMGLTQDRLDTLVAGALLHDVGKIGVSDSILQKPGALSKEEEQIMRQHPVVGASLIGEIEELKEAMPAVRHHHERFDGAGYPDGLEGEEIPLEARIVLVADAFDSMIRGRPYRFRISTTDALRELARHAGTQFDPEVVEAFVRVLEQDTHLSDSAM
jgi:HD-GYP domain-containing protein (c-di-GMP phosphodiesterase class II)